MLENQGAEAARVSFSVQPRIKLVLEPGNQRLGLIFIVFFSPSDFMGSYTQSLIIENATVLGTSSCFLAMHFFYLFVHILGL